MIENVILFIMILCYITPIVFVSYVYIKNNNESISSIICDASCNLSIKLSMIFMCFFTIIYELLRHDIYTLTIMTFLVVSILGVLYSNEQQYKHYVYAFTVFTSILFFMIYNAIKKNNIIMYTLFVLQIIITLITLIYIRKNIFIVEAMAILNFAIFYLYVHFTIPNIPNH